MKQVVVLVGRPNVGKSTLFNRLTRSRAALVSDVPGVTRDRQYGDGRIGDKPYFVVDTGGIVEGVAMATASPDGDRSEMRKLISMQTREALTEGDAIILIVDGREGLHPIDRELATDIRRLGKPVWLAVNKTEGHVPETAVAEFHALGLGAPHAISSAHGEGVPEMMEHILATFPVYEENAESTDNVPRIAIIGKPNVGKSTLVNALLGEERVVVCDQPGTTRDSIHVPIERSGKRYILIDTAGVRRRARIDDALEKFSVIKTLHAIDEANVAILIIDAKEGVSDQDAGLAGYALERGRAMVVAVNKWDLVDESDRDWVKRELERKLAFLDFARAHFVSAKEGQGIGSLFPSVDEAYMSAHKVLPTPKLTRLLEEAVTVNPPPMAHGRRIRLKYAHQGGKNPPIVVVHGNQAASLSDAYRRYLSNFFRKAFRLVGTPIRVECRTEKNPYEGRKTTPRRKLGKAGKHQSVRKRT